MERDAIKAPDAGRPPQPFVHHLRWPRDFEFAKEDSLLYLGKLKRNWYTLTFNLVHIRRCCGSTKESEEVLRALERDGLVRIVDPKPPRLRQGEAYAPSTAAYVEVTEAGRKRIESIKSAVLPDF